MNACQYTEEELKIAQSAKILLVGAGGIGCEVLKCLVQKRYENIVVVDMDTIVVSNLNRQFLFSTSDIGKPKAETAVKSVLSHYPTANLKAYTKSIMDNSFNIQWFKEYSLVINALDNVNARSHVNRMCIAADVPMIDTGTTGYSGQVQFYQKGVTSCYDCYPSIVKAKSYPSCTIRNKPTESIHCIVWAKHLFNQLFGEDDDQTNVSPDMEDHNNTTDSGIIKRISTNAWARECNYDPGKLFDKFFCEDIEYLLSLHHLWESKNIKPIPMKYTDAKHFPKSIEPMDHVLKQSILDIPTCVRLFENSINTLKQRLSPSNDKFLVWDKDDDASMDFLSACATIRCHIFSIEKKSPYDVKSMAGNIIPAIATSNAMIAGICVMSVMKILKGGIADCRNTYIRKQCNHIGQIISPEFATIVKSPSCYICSENKLIIKLDPDVVTPRILEKQLRAELSLVEPEVVVENLGAVLISPEQQENEEYQRKILSSLNVGDGTMLSIYDLQQECSFRVVINAKRSKEDDDLLVEIVFTDPKLQENIATTEDEEKISNSNNGIDYEVVDDRKRKSNSMDESEAKKQKIEADNI